MISIQLLVQVFGSHRCFLGRPGSSAVPVVPMVATRLSCTAVNIITMLAAEASVVPRAVSLWRIAVRWASVNVLFSEANGSATLLGDLDLDID